MFRETKIVSCISLYFLQNQTNSECSIQVFLLLKIWPKTKEHLLRQILIIWCQSFEKTQQLSKFSFWTKFEFKKPLCSAVAVASNVRPVTSISTIFSSFGASGPDSRSICPRAIRLWTTVLRIVSWSYSEGEGKKSRQIAKNKNHVL